MWVFEGRGLRDWLNRTLADQIGATGERPVTFADLHRSTGVELYVVAMDLAKGLPVVFCHRTTRNVEVAGAVAASVAIPGHSPRTGSVRRSWGGWSRTCSLRCSRVEDRPSPGFSEMLDRLNSLGVLRKGLTDGEHRELLRSRDPNTVSELIIRSVHRIGSHHAH